MDKNEFLRYIVMVGVAGGLFFVSKNISAVFAGMLSIFFIKDVILKNEKIKKLASVILLKSKKLITFATPSPAPTSFGNNGLMKIIWSAVKYVVYLFILLFFVLFSLTLWFLTIALKG